jgi:hypothetical protein
MQRMYEELRQDGKSQKEAIKEVSVRFSEYDEGLPLSVFVK